MTVGNLAKPILVIFIAIESRDGKLFKTSRWNFLAIKAFELAHFKNQTNLLKNAKARKFH